MYLLHRVEVLVIEVPQEPEDARSEYLSDQHHKGGQVEDEDHPCQPVEEGYCALKCISDEGGVERGRESVFFRNVARGDKMKQPKMGGGQVNLCGLPMRREGGNREMPPFASSINPESVTEKPCTTDICGCQVVRQVTTHIPYVCVVHIHVQSSSWLSHLVPSADSLVLKTSWTQTDSEERTISNTSI